MGTQLTTICRRALQAICGALLLLGGSALAQAPPMTPSGGGLMVELAGHRVVVPPPVWTAASDQPVEQARTLFTVLAPGVESLVLLPVGETAVTWTRLMGILVVERPGYTAATQLASVVDPVTAACAPNELYATTFGGGERGSMLLLCGRYKPNAPGVPRRCGGGMILATVLQSAEGAAKIYHEWCTPAFDVTDRAGWPVAASDLEAHANLLMAIAALAPLPPRRADAN